MNKTWERIVSALYPRQCPICREIVTPKGDTICRKCRDGLPYIKEARCRKCSKPVHNPQIEYCYDCSRQRHLYIEGIAMFEHKGAIRDTIYDIKYGNKREYLDFFADEIAEKYGNKIKEWQADALVPVPLYKKKEIQRGFNQAMELAKRLGKRMDIPVNGKILLRDRVTVPQKELTEKQRKKNVENAFHISENIVKLNRVILIDDIYTTGSTIDACTETLLNAGVREVYFITMSIGDGL